MELKLIPCSVLLVDDLLSYEINILKFCYILLITVMIINEINLFMFYDIVSATFIRKVHRIFRDFKGLKLNIISYLFSMVIRNNLSLFCVLV